MSLLDNLKVSHKLALGFGFCLAIFAIATIVSIMQMQDMNERMKTVAQVADKELAGSLAIGRNIRGYRVDALLIVITSDRRIEDAAKADMAVKSELIQKGFGEYDKLATDPADRANLQKLKDDWLKIKGVEEPFLAAAYKCDDTAKDPAAIQRTLENMRICDRIQNVDAAAYFSGLATTIDDMIQWNEKQSAEQTALATAAYVAARNTSLSLLAIALILSTIMASLITRSTTSVLDTIIERLKSLEGICITNLRTTLAAMASGDLTVKASAGTKPLQMSRKDEFGQLGSTFDGMVAQVQAGIQALGETQDSLSKVISQTMSAAEGIADASDQLASGNADLSARTAEQASSLEETAASMEEMTSIVKQSAENARQASGAANESKVLAIDGGAVVESAVESMRGIEDASRKIAEIVSVIDEIAFQTNLLALNAAVEAARVGEQGKGFAVVAGEVRALAGRSASAAKEIKALVADTVSRVETGAAQVNRSGEQLKNIVSSGASVADSVAAISNAAQEQSAGIEQVNKAIINMDEITQKNAALVEESAAASEEMSQQARELRDLVRRFKIDESYTSAMQSTSSLHKATGTYGAPAHRAASRPQLQIVGDDDMEF